KRSDSKLIKRGPVVRNIIDFLWNFPGPNGHDVVPRKDGGRILDDSPKCDEAYLRVYCTRVFDDYFSYVLNDIKSGLFSLVLQYEHLSKVSSLDSVMTINRLALGEFLAPLYVTQARSNEIIRQMYGIGERRRKSDDSR